MAFSWFSNSSVIKYYSIFVKLQKLTYLWFLENGIIGLFGEILDQLYTTVLLTDLRKTHQKGFIFSNVYPSRRDTIFIQCCPVCLYSCSCRPNPRNTLFDSLWISFCT